MPASNSDIAGIFDEIADLLEIQGENAFRIRAYRNAARVIEGLGVSAADMLKKDEDLTELPGIGKDLAEKIREIVDTGTCAALEKLRRQLPPTITTLLQVPGLGPKRVQALYRNLDISTAEQLRAAAREGQIRGLKGFGEKTEALILQALDRRADSAKRFVLAEAARYAEPLRAYLGRIAGVRNVAIAGSYRRAKETVGDLDIVVAAKRGEMVMDRFCDYPQVARVVSKGDTRSTVILANGLQVDLRAVPAVSFGAALYYFTGSKAHNIATRRMAQSRGLKINEYGVFRANRRIAGDTEQSVFRAVGLPYIPPELRENRGEIEAARAGKLPKLVSREDLQGDLHINAPADIGALKEWVHAARRSGLRYLAVTLSGRTDAASLRQRFEAVDRMNKTLRGFGLLKAIEAEILEDGKLAAPDSLLGDCDLVIAALKPELNLPRAKRTQRLLRAIADPRVTMLAHPAGRLLGRPSDYEVDVPRVIRAARDRGCILELDAQPDRLDLPDVYCRLAKDEGVLVSINSAARDTGDFDHLAHGVGQGRRGWLEAKDVANTRSLAELKALLAKIRGATA
jgi:DNA polymerase (family X)